MPKLHEPIAGFRPLAYPQGDITQFFGENPALYKSCCGLKGHNGWDIVRAHGTPIFCVQSGKVVDVKEEITGNGKHLRILCESGEWIYGHLSRIDVTLSQQVIVGQQIGLMGNTGFVISDHTAGGYWEYNPYAGTHLHLTFYAGKIWTNESQWNKSYPSGDKMILSDPNNGYNGATEFNAEWFGQKKEELKPSEKITLQAAEAQAKGHKDAPILWALAALLRSFGV